MRLPRRSVSRNVSRKPPFIAVPGYHHCKPLLLATICGRSRADVSCRDDAHAISGTAPIFATSLLRCGRDRRVRVDNGCANFSVASEFHMDDGAAHWRRNVRQLRFGSSLFHGDGPAGGIASRRDGRRREFHQLRLTSAFLSIPDIPEIRSIPGMPRLSRSPFVCGNRLDIRKWRLSPLGHRSRRPRTNVRLAFSRWAIYICHLDVLAVFRAARKLSHA
jgi:hypothetical protein